MCNHISTVDGFYSIARFGTNFERPIIENHDLDLLYGMCIDEAPGSRTWPPPFFPPPQSLLLDNKPTCIGNHHGGQPLELSLYMYCVDNHLAPHHGAASHSRTNTTIGR